MKSYEVKEDVACNICKRKKIEIRDSTNHMFVLWCTHCDGWPFKLGK
jgi:hypothetical protein